MEKILSVYKLFWRKQQTLAQDSTSPDQRIEKNTTSLGILIFDIHLKEGVVVINKDAQNLYIYIWIL